MGNSKSKTNDKNHYIHLLLDNVEFHTPALSKKEQKLRNKINSYNYKNIFYNDLKLIASANLLGLKQKIIVKYETDDPIFDIHYINIMSFYIKSDKVIQNTEFGGNEIPISKITREDMIDSYGYKYIKYSFYF